MQGITALAALVAAVLPSATAAQVEPPAAPQRAQVMAAARDVIETARYATLATIGDNGQPQARIVDPLPNPPRAAGERSE